MVSSKLSAEKADMNKLSVVAIGVSTGGFEACKALFSAVPADTGMAFVVVQHVDTGEDGFRSDMLAPYTKMEVLEAQPRIEIKPDCIYIVPQGLLVECGDGMFIPSSRISQRGPVLPVDAFFSSLARNHRYGAIGVILSGKGSDGVAGLKAIKLSGGITFAQDSSAAYGQMPGSAIAEGIVDLVLSPAEIAKELELLSRQSSPFSESAQTREVVSDTDEHLMNIVHLLKRSTGVDFFHYKISTIKRRILRRMLLYKLGDLKAYYDHLNRHSNEISILYHDLLINVTCFFRDEDSMEFLKKSILPRILESKAGDDPVRVWVPACSTGEEAYSLAILLVELQEESGKRAPIQIFGTDLSEAAISKARQGVYSLHEIAEISDGRLAKYFVPAENNCFRIHKTIRDLCVFAQHNVFKDPPFSRLDLISCCNFFIYLDSTLQQKCINLFHYSLNQQGYLVLGKSETIVASGQQLFSPVEKKFKVYVKKQSGPAKAVSELSYQSPIVERRSLDDKKKKPVKDATEMASLEKVVDDILYDKYVPPSVVINQEMEILQFRGEISTFLEPSRGRASFNLMKMIRPDLTFDLRNCVHKAMATRSQVEKTDVEFVVNGKTRTVKIEVVPLPSNNDDSLFLIILKEGGVSAAEVQASFSKDLFVRKLQDELEAVRNDMRAFIDEQEANKEELQSANEEIISSNEELQSINEELETSKEEVESANEELMAINAELQISNEQLTESKEYAEAIFETIREAVVVLNKDFRVKLANASFYTIFHAKPETTEGVSVFDIGDGQWNTPKIRALLNGILNRGLQLEGYEMDYHIYGVGLRTMLINARKVIQNANKQELILVAFEDITDRKAAELLRIEREEWFRNMANNAPVMIWTADPNGLRTFFNVTWLTYTGRSVEQELEEGWVNDIYPLDKDAFLSVYKKAFEDRQPFEIDYRLRRHDGNYRWVKAIGKPTFSTDKEFAGFVGICTEIHNARMMQEELEAQVAQRTVDLQEANKELKKSNAELQQFAYVASHDLQEPLRKILMFSDRLTLFDDLSAPVRGYIDKITTSADRMSRLIHDVLDFSGAIKVNDRFASTDLGKILEYTLQDFDVLIKEKKAMIVAEGLPVIEAIPLQMEQLFHNLISNGLKFSKPLATPVIRIMSRTITGEDVSKHGLDREKEYVELIFEDNGIGFSNEFAEQIFVIFKRLHGRQEYQGTGIGLALCRKIANNHGGLIFATSIEQVRTEFHVILPVEQTLAG